MRRGEDAGRRRRPPRSPRPPRPPRPGGALAGGAGRRGAQSRPGLSRSPLDPQAWLLKTRPLTDTTLAGAAHHPCSQTVPRSRQGLLIRPAPTSGRGEVRSSQAGREPGPRPAALAGATRHIPMQSLPRVPSLRPHRNASLCSICREPANRRPRFPGTHSFALWPGRLSEARVLRADKLNLGANMRPPGPTHRALRAPRRPVALGPVRLHLQSAGGVQGRSLKPLTTPAGSGPSGSWPPPPASPGVRVPVGREASRRPCVPLRTWPTGSGGGILAAGGGVGRGPELQAAVGPAGACTGQQCGRHRAGPSGGPGAMWARQTGTEGAPPGGSRGRRAPRESACTGAQQRARWEWVPRSDSCPQVPVLNPTPQVPGSEASGGRHEAGPLSEDRDRPGRNAGAMSAQPCRSLGARRLLLRGAGLTSGPGTVCNRATGLRCWHRGCH